MSRYIEGFAERVDEACHRTGRSKREIAEQCGFDRKVLCKPYHNSMMHSGYLARFCAVTGTDANWLLGLKA